MLWFFAFVSFSLKFLYTLVGKKMVYYLSKIVISAMLIVLISELAKRNVIAGSVLASIPFVSVFAIFWLYFETKDIQQVAYFSKNLFWLVLPSLILFIFLPICLKLGWGFYPSLLASMLSTILGYFVMLYALGLVDIKM